MIPSTPIQYVGKKSKHLDLFPKLIGDRDSREVQAATGFLDLTAGSSTVALLFTEYYGFKTIMLNDLSPWTKLVARAFFEQAAMDAEEIAEAILSVTPTDGFVRCTRGRVGSRWSLLFNDDAAAWIDGYATRHMENPLLQIALSCVILSGATRFAHIRTQVTTALTPTKLRNETYRRALQLARRQKMLGGGFTWSSENYLALPSSFDDMNGWIVYLDPAWPEQLNPGYNKLTVPNSMTYGLQATVMMEILSQQVLPTIEEYDVAPPMFWVGMRNTIERMSRGNRMLVAFQTNDDMIDDVSRRLFPDQNVRMVSSDKSHDRLREYLFHVEN